MARFSNAEQVFVRGKLVMAIGGEAGKIDVADRLNIYMVRSKRHKNKSDAMEYLMRVGLDLNDIDGDGKIGIPYEEDKYKEFLKMVKEWILEQREKEKKEKEKENVNNNNKQDNKQNTT